MVGTLAGDLIAHVSPTAGGGEVQQLGFPVASRVQDLLVVEQRRNQAQHQVTSRLATALQVGQAKNRFHGVGKDRVLIGAAGVNLALTEQDVPAQIQVARHLRQRHRRHHHVVQLHELALGQVGVAPVHFFSDRQGKHRIAQELQALVMLHPGVLEGVGAVG